EIIRLDLKPIEFPDCRLEQLFLPFFPTIIVRQFVRAREIKSRREEGRVVGGMPGSLAFFHLNGSVEPEELIFRIAFTNLLRIAVVLRYLIQVINMSVIGQLGSD